MYKTVVFINTTKLYNYHQNIFFTPKETSHPLAEASPFPSTEPVATINLLSVSMYFPVLDILYECNYIICSLLCLSSFAGCHVSVLTHVIVGISTSLPLKAESHPAVYIHYIF